MGFDEQYFKGDEDKRTLGLMTDMERNDTLLERKRRIEIESEKLVLLSEQAENQKKATNHSQSLAGTKRKKSAGSSLQETSSYESLPRSSKRMKFTRESPQVAGEEHEEEAAAQD
jgi:hypothetical protein